jgi:hypothetical protein
MDVCRKSKKEELNIVIEFTHFMNIQDEEQKHKPNSFFIHVKYAVVPNAPGALDLVFYGGLLRRFDCLVIEK